MTSVFLLGWKILELRWQTGQNAPKCAIKMEPEPFIFPLTSTKNKLFLPSVCFGNRFCKYAACPVRHSGKPPLVNTAVLLVHGVTPEAFVV